MFTGFYTTAKGKSYISHAVAGKTLILTKGQYGKGILPEDISPETMTALIAPIANMPISKKNVTKNCVTTTTQFSNRINGSILPPFHMHEAGIFGKLLNDDGTDYEDGPETLLLYAYEKSTEKADYIPESLTEFIINWPLTISRTDKITVKIDESLIYPTMADLNDRVGKRVTASATETETGSTLDVESDIPLADNLQIMVKLSQDLSANPTIRYNGEEEYPVYNADGSEVSDGQFVAGSTMGVIFNEAKQCWFITGGGGSAKIATVEEAKSGTDDTKMMTPYKVSLYVDKVLGDVNTIIDSINGEVI